MQIDDSSDAITIKIMPNDKGNPPEKLADAQVHFGAGPLAGMTFIGFSIWERQDGRDVTFPAWQFFVDLFALMRLTDISPQERIRDLILKAYADGEAVRSASNICCSEKD